MPSLGQELRTRREERGSSLKDISTRTKISLWMLQALEDDRFALIPEPFFLKGVLRTYVQAIGADEGYFLRRLAEETKGLPPVVKPVVEPVPSGPLRPSRTRLFIGIAVVFLAFAVFLIVRSRSKPPAGPTNSAPAAQSLRPPETRLSSPGPTESPAVREPALRLELTIMADTWLRIAADGSPIFEGVLIPGRTAVFKAEKELLLQIGNAGGFTYKLNGKPGKPLGPPGGVRADVRITLQTLAEFQVSPGGAPQGQ